MTNLAKYLLEQFKKYQGKWKEASCDFDKLESRFPGEIIERWELMGTRPFIGRDGKPHSPFQVDSAQGESITTVFVSPD